MIKLIKGGDYAKKGYCYHLALYFPEFSNSTTINMMRSKHKSFKVSFPSKIEVTRNSSYFNILFCFMGFGIELEIQSKV